MPKYINFGSSESATLLHDGWWQPEGNFRWSSGHATFTIRGGAASGAELVLTGTCPKQHLEKGPIHLTVTIDGQRLPTSTITEQNLSFELRYPLPQSAIGKPSVEIALDVDRTLAYPRPKSAWSGYSECGNRQSGGSAALSVRIHQMSVPAAGTSPTIRNAS